MSRKRKEPDQAKSSEPFKGLTLAMSRKYPTGKMSPYPSAE
jgi:hypothetical protein